MKVKKEKYREIKLKRGREISPRLQQDLLKHYGFKIVQKKRGKLEEDN